MHTITLRVKDESALKTLKNLENKQLISIIQDIDLDSPALPGSRLSVAQFRKFVKEAEQGPTISLEDAKKKWALKKKELRGLMK